MRTPSRPWLASCVLFQLLLAPAANAQGTPCLEWSREFTGPDLDGGAFAATVWDDGTGPALYVGGIFQVAGGQTARHIARWTGWSWSPLAGGVTLVGGATGVFALAVYDEDQGGPAAPALFAAGNFTQMDGQPISSIARWDGQSWSPVGGGINGTVRAMAVFDDGMGPALYAGGTFNSAGGNGAINTIARWNGTSWSGVGGGLDDDVRALVVHDDGTGPALYAGGRFQVAGGMLTGQLARWNGAGWTEVGGGLTGGGLDTVNALVSFDEDGSGPGQARLFVAGEMSQVGDDVAVMNIAAWDGTAWDALGGGTAPEDHLTVECLHVHDDGSGPLLYAGGFFTNMGGVAAARIAKWDGQSWSPLAEGIANGQVNTMATFDDGTGTCLFPFGGFTRAGNSRAFLMAKWTGLEWVPRSNQVGESAGHAVSAMLPHDDGSGEALYVGGFFTTVGGTNVSNIGRYRDGEWTSLDAGPNSSVRAMGVFGGDLIVGGQFGSAGSVAPVAANLVARWTGTAWAPLANGLGAAGFTPDVSALEVFDDGSGEALYAGGSFLNIRGVNALNIASAGPGGWANVGAGLNDIVHTTAEVDYGSGPVLFAGGRNLIAVGSNFARAARFDGTTWQPMLTGLLSATTVYDMVAFDDGAGEALYACGQLRIAIPGGGFCENVGRWDGTRWQPVGTGIGSIGFNVVDLAVADLGAGATLYAAGNLGVHQWTGTSWMRLGPEFGTTCVVVHDDGTGPALYAGTSPAYGGVVKWNGTTWTAVSSGGFNDLVQDLTVYDPGTGSLLVAAGYFTQVGPTQARRVAAWNGTAWTALGTGIDGNGTEVQSLAVVDEDGAGPGAAVLYVGGLFTSAGGVPSSSVARWDGSSWTPTDGIQGHVFTLRTRPSASGDELVAGGQFGNAGLRPALRMARWDGANWSEVGGGLNEIVSAIAIFDADAAGPAPAALVVGGRFTTAGGQPASRIALWDGSGWSALGSGIAGPASGEASVNALAVFDEDGAGPGAPALFVGGQFVSAGGVAVNAVARWDGTSWSAVGDGFGPQLPTPPLVDALAVFDDGTGPALYAAGRFTTADGLPAMSIAKWTGTAWIAVEEGLNAAAATLAVVGDSPSHLYVGGSFTSAGAVSSVRLAKWGPCPPRVSVPTCPADWNDDDAVNSNDISAFLTSWLMSVQGGTLEADFNNDDAVNSNDISTFLTAWLDAVQNGC